MLAEQLVADFVRAWNDHDVEGVAALHAPEYKGEDVGEATPHYRRSGVRQRMERYLRAFPDLQLEPEETVIQGNRAVLLWRAQGTHRGTFMNIPATGRKVTFRGISLLLMNDGQVIRGIYVWDVAGLLRDLRLLPDL